MGTVTGLRYQRQGLLASKQLLNMQKGTRLNALLLMRGTVIAQQCGAIRFTAAYLRNTTSESLPTERFEFDSDAVVSALLFFYRTPSCSIADFRDADPPLQTRAKPIVNTSHFRMTSMATLRASL